MEPYPLSPVSSGVIPDRLTLIAISALAYVIAVGLHEHLGHSAACVLLGSRANEMGAFYVDCDDSRLGGAAVRLVALAGPLVSTVTGFVFLALARTVRPAVAFYFCWLLGALGLMDAAGYLVFSGVSGLGDLGTTSDGALQGIAPEWLWRIAEAAAGALAYWAVVRHSVRVLEPRLSGVGAPRVRVARLTAMISYVSGAVVYLAIGSLNPHGLVIVITSALASSMGGTSGLLWMTSFIGRNPSTSGSGLYFGRSWPWISAAFVITLVYAAILGPTLRP